MADTPKAAIRAPFGRAALLTTSVLFITFTYLLYFGGLRVSGTDSFAGVTFAVLIYGCGIVLSIISIARGEPRKHAIITLVSLLCGHLILRFLFILPWFVYSLSL